MIYLSRYYLGPQMMDKRRAELGEERNAYRVLVGKPKGVVALGRPMRRWENNINMYLIRGRGLD
jgi:hypothetical protein